jgi:hypothetical protein
MLQARLLCHRLFRMDFIHVQLEPHTSAKTSGNNTGESVSISLIMLLVQLKCSQVCIDIER